MRPAAAAALAVVVTRVLRDRPALARVNHRGAVVSLASGPAIAVAAVAGARLPLPPVATAGLLAAGLGAYDDVAGRRPEQARDKGLHGHLAALRAGRVSAGAVKVVGIGAAALLAAALRPGGRRPVDLLLDAGVVAGSANLVNLLDLRPGRALKAGGAAALALRQPGVAAAALALLPGDLGERTMLGDTGANALGAVLGLALLERLPARPERARTLAALTVLTAASEVVSYSSVIDATPPLRWLDRLGRRP